ncbi:MAG: GNAT family N-acetyltransferase [Thermoguttaceae bacterium]|jgi:GNAT superfamily N-acetyltransferase
MPDLVVQAVTTRRARKQFVEFPWSLYRGDPNWIPPLRADQKGLLGYAGHPFYVRNRIQTFVALRGGEVRGRIAAILNQGHIERFHERRGFFGFFECIDDQAVADGLLHAARRWLAEQDVYCLRGPTNPSLNYEVGTLIDGFDSPPTFMMTYNKPYYPRLLETHGLRKTQDAYAFWGSAALLPKSQEKLHPLADEIKNRYNVHIRPMNTRRFLDDVRMFLSIYNRSLSNTWGFVPMSQSEVEHMARGLRHLIVPELSLCAEMDGKPVGAMVCLPDYNPRIRRIDGRLLPFGFLHLLRKKHEIKKIRILSANVLPEYQRLGLGVVLLDGIVPKVREWGIEEAEFSWVLESNSLSRGALKKGGAVIQKTYRLYDLDTPIAPSRP